MVNVSTCHRCTEPDPDDLLVECGDCGTTFHESCYEYFTQFVCSRCGDERWIGALEFSPPQRPNAIVKRKE